MSTLKFIVSVMSAGKTARLLQLNFDYKRVKKKTMLFKPALDTRETVIKSRMGIEEKCNIISGVEDLEQIKDVDTVFIDEAQFLSVEEVNKLRAISAKEDIEIYCFGLKSDFMGNLFEGSRRLFEVADSFEELTTMCLCGKRATMNLKYDNKSGEVIKKGNSIDCGYEDMYMSVCYDHWTVKNISEIA